ncbi:MAG TPA: ComF family protein [Chloroflexi bacterium]|jgi:ComF family protein|nr:ComF family protein [Anaerolineaceae bacterium]HHX09656.1 ComF family protein [Chloroflexota bacterium]
MAVDRNPSQIIQKISLNVIDWLFPPACLGCGKEGVVICQECFSKIQVLPKNVCNYCGEFTSKQGRCPKCGSHKPSYAGFRAFAYYTGIIRSAIHRLKYQNDISIGFYLAELLRTELMRTNWQIDVIVPVPIGEEKRKSRGYNQAERLAKPLASLTQIDYQPLALRRIREVGSQVGLDKLARQANVKDAFVAQASLVKDKTVLVVDDVFTSGATMEACSSELLYAGAKEIYCLSLAKVNNEISQIDFLVSNNV